MHTAQAPLELQLGEALAAILCRCERAWTGSWEGKLTEIEKGLFDLVARIGRYHGQLERIMPATSPALGNWHVQIQFIVRKLVKELKRRPEDFRAKLDLVERENLFDVTLHLVETQPLLAELRTAVEDAVRDGERDDWPRGRLIAVGYELSAEADQWTYVGGILTRDAEEDAQVRLRRLPERVQARLTPLLPNWPELQDVIDDHGRVEPWELLQRIVRITAAQPLSQKEPSNPPIPATTTQAPPSEAVQPGANKSTVPASGSEPAKQPDFEPHVRKAMEAWRWAASHWNGNEGRFTDRIAHQILMDRVDAPEVPDNFDTFTAYIRKYRQATGTQLNRRRLSGDHPNVISRRDVEPPRRHE